MGNLCSSRPSVAHSPRFFVLNALALRAVLLVILTVCDRVGLELEATFVKFKDVKDLNDLSNCIAIDKKTLAYFAHVAPRAKKYTQFTIKKKGGGTRKISAPTKKLKQIQRAIQIQLDEHHTPKSCNHGYIQNRSIITNTKVHVGQRWLGKVDLSSYFSSIHTGRVVGLLRAAPFSLPKDIAIIIAKLCTDEKKLPQGAPTSPVISNLITRRLDSKLKALARENKCYYTRYADDIFFSTNKRLFPSEILTLNENKDTVCGEKLAKILKHEDFEVNSDKVSLKDNSQRKIVTGIVVNEKMNVPKDYIREIRTLLHSWKTYGFEQAEQHWQNKYAPKNKPGVSTPCLRKTLKGKINHISAVKGKQDEIYLKYAKELAKIDDTFTIDPKLVSASIVSEIRVYSEGKTDLEHISAAQQYFHSKAQYTNIRIVTPQSDISGDDLLQKHCKLLSQTSQDHLSICVFDSDVDKITKAMKGSTSQYKDHGNNVFSVVLPPPTFRDEDRICIEHLFSDNDLFKTDAKGRRLFKRNEFNTENGTHLTERGLVCLYPKKTTLIVDADVINVMERINVALPKALFSKYITEKTPPFDTVSFEGFIPLFDLFSELYNGYISD